MPNEDIYFSSENLDMYLKEFAKEFKKINGKNVPISITMVGGAAIMANYNFRAKTYDVDAVATVPSLVKEAANRVGDKYNLPNGWLNSDFRNTKSYTPKINQYSKYYKTFSNVVEFRTMTAEYLVAMKLMAGRPYKHDLSDVAEIYAEHQRRGDPLTYDMILTAVKNLYDDVSKLPESSVDFLQLLVDTKDIDKLIADRKEYEESSKIKLLQFEKEYENVLKEDNLEDILNSLEAKEKTNKQIDYTDD